MQEFELLGYVTYRDEKGEQKFMVTLGTPCTEQENKTGRFGLNVTKQFLPLSEAKKVTPECVGTKYYLSTGFNSFGKVEIIGLSPVSNI